MQADLETVHAKLLNLSTDSLARSHRCAHIDDESVFKLHGGLLQPIKPNAKISFQDSS